jgi:hypothetical protein
MDVEGQGTRPTYHYAAVKDAADNGRSRARGPGQRHSLGVQGRIAVVVGEVEARHLVVLLVMLMPCSSRALSLARDLACVR